MTRIPLQQPRLDLLIGVFDREQQAQILVERLIEDDFPPDRVSLLHKGGGEGDDMLGISFHVIGERVRAWGEQGAFWAGADPVLELPVRI